jgi:hypothetical protein
LAGFAYPTLADRSWADATRHLNRLALALRHAPPGRRTDAAQSPLPTVTLASQIVGTPAPPTRTPSPPEECPAVDPGLQADFQSLVDQYGQLPEDEPVLDFLNAGGSPEAALAALQSLDWPGGAVKSEIADVTGDGVRDFMLGLDNLYFMVCESGEFNTVDVVRQENGPVRVEAIQI